MYQFYEHTNKYEYKQLDNCLMSAYEQQKILKWFSSSRRKYTLSIAQKLLASSRTGMCLEEYMAFFYEGNRYIIHGA